ncbi:MAG: APC family permease [Saprospiraceae bacterium]
MQSNQPESLPRKIGVLSLAANAMNLTIGSGIFVLPAVVAASVGAASVMAYIICGILITLIMLCFAEVGSKVTSSGGAYAYVETAFGPFAGFLTNSLFWFGYAMMSDAAIANALVDTLSVPFPFLSKFVNKAVLLIILFSFFAWINIRGVKQGTRLVEINTLAKLIPLLLLIFVGIFFIQPQNLQWQSTPSIQSLGEVSLVLFFAFLGIEAALSVSGEIKHPTKTVPRGILLGLTGVLLVYLLLQTVAQGILGDALQQEKDAPLAAVAQQLFGNWGATLIIIGAAVSMFGTVSGDILASPRLIYAAAKDRLLPTFFARIHPRYTTPHIAIMTYAGLGLIFALSGGFQQLAILASAATLMIYLAVVLATIKLRFTQVAPRGSFKIPGGILIPILAVLVIGWFLSNLKQQEWLALAIFFAVMTVIYLLGKLWQKHIARR